MNIACTMGTGRGDTDQLLFEVAKRLQNRELKVCGTVQVNTDREDCSPCDMDVMVLPEGKTLRISQDLGRHSKGCRLDPEALETAVGLVEAALHDGADCVIINKFGKQEAEGKGFRGTIAQALTLGIPVLVGLNSLNKDAFHSFAEGLDTELPPNADDLETWLVSKITDG